MRLSILVSIAAIFLTTPGFSQNPPTDSQTMRELLEEVRLLRRDLQTTTVAAQRVQIALYRLQLQDAAVARSTRVLDDAQNRLADIAESRRRAAAGLEQLEESLNRTQSARERKTIEDEALPELKRRMELLGKEEEIWQGRKVEAEAQLRTEQGKLNDLHGLLDQLEQALQDVGRTTGKGPAVIR